MTPLTPHSYVYSSNDLSTVQHASTIKALSIIHLLHTVIYVVLMTYLQYKTFHHNEPYLHTLAPLSWMEHTVVTTYLQYMLPP